VLGIVPMNKIADATPASASTRPITTRPSPSAIVTHAAGTSDLMSYYPEAVKDWIRRNGGLTTEMKKITNGADLWKIVDPCPEEF
jgi:hypothetical protein